jgi:hypothetical protein
MRALSAVHYVTGIVALHSARPVCSHVYGLIYMVYMMPMTDDPSPTHWHCKLTFCRTLTYTLFLIKYRITLEIVPFLYCLFYDIQFIHSILLSCCLMCSIFYDYNICDKIYKSRQLVKF